MVVLCAAFIFIMSCMNTDESNGKSKSAINTVVNTGIETTNKAGVTNKHPSEAKITNVTDKLNKPLRKVAHATEYFAFTFFVAVALRCSGVKDKRVLLFAILMCFLYSCTDEFHQTFVYGRTGQFTDCLIDTAGGAIACLLMLFVWNKKEKREVAV